ncbi:hypothetical protein BCEN4_1170017 [Burkholderia cenocepacia]|nr:hypothetical protein BCEN4_1170017 [Burkholderia cenocepacia]
MPGEARNTRRRTGMGHGGDEASKRVGGFYRSAKCLHASVPGTASDHAAESARGAGGR